MPSAWGLSLGRRAGGWRCRAAWGSLTLTVDPGDWRARSRALRAGRRDGAAAPAKAGGSVEGPGGAGGRGAGHTPTAPAAFPLGARAQPPTRTAAWRVRGSLGPPFSGGRPTGLRLTERTSEPTPDAVGGGRQRPRPASHGAGAAGLRSPRRELAPGAATHCGSRRKHADPEVPREGPKPFQSVSPRGLLLRVRFLGSVAALLDKYTLCKLKVSIMNKEKYQS